VKWKWLWGGGGHILLASAKIDSDAAFISNSFNYDLFDSIQTLQTILLQIPAELLNLKTNKDLV
jgi:hypothetical protein